MSEQKTNTESSDVTNVPTWLENNKESFKPPICNKLMYSDQLKVMFIGGPNTRSDFHIDAGEEFFYQMKGNMSLPIFEKGEYRKIDIKEGEVFLLPGLIPHSPQRPEEGSVGLVCERERVRPEMDAMRWYCKDNKTPLWEKWFFCSDLGTQLPGIVKKFNESEESRTDKPKQNSICDNPPVNIDTETNINAPLNLMEFINKNEEDLEINKILNLFKTDQTIVNIYTGPFKYNSGTNVDTWIYVMEGNCKVSFNNIVNRRDRKPLDLKKGDSTLINSNEQYGLLMNSKTSRVMSVSIKPINGGYTRKENSLQLQENLRVYIRFDGWPRPIKLDLENYIGFEKDENFIRSIKFDDDLKLRVTKFLKDESLQFEELRVGIKDFNDRKPKYTLIDLNNQEQLNKLSLSYDIDGWSAVHIWFKTKDYIENQNGRPYPQQEQE